MNIQQIKQVLKKIESSQDLKSFEASCNELSKIEGINKPVKKFRVFYLPVKLNINGTLIDYVINADKTFIDFESEIIETFGISGPLTISIDVVIDRIYYDRQMLNYVLKPLQVIEINSLDNSTQPIIPQHNINDVIFPWTEFFNAFNKLLKNKSKFSKDDIANKLLPIICKIPNDQHMFNYETDLTQLLCLCHLFVQNRRIEMTQQQCIDAINYTINSASPRMFWFIISTLLRICVMNGYKLTDECLKKIKEKSENKSIISDNYGSYALSMYSYYCSEVEMKVPKFLPYLEEASHYDLIIDADSEFDLEEEEVLYVFYQLQEFLENKKQPKKIQTRKSVLWFEIDGENNKNENQSNKEKHYFTETIEIYSYLYLINKLVTKYGFKQVPKKLCQILINMLFPQIQEKNSTPMLGIQSMNLLINIIAQSPKLMEFVSQYYMQIITKQAEQGSVYLNHTFDCYFKEVPVVNDVALNEKEIVANIYALFYISFVDGLENEIMSFMDNFMYFPPRRIELSQFSTTKDLKSMSEQWETLFCLMAVNNEIYTTNAECKDESDLISALQTDRRVSKQNKYCYCSFKTPTNVKIPLIDMQNDSNSYYNNKVIVIICEDYSLLVRNGNENTFLTIKDGKLQRYETITKKGEIKLTDSLTIQNGMMIRGIVYRSHSSNATKLENFNLTMRLIDTTDTLIRTSSQIAKVMSPQQLVQLLKLIITRYESCVTSSIYIETKKHIKTLPSEMIQEIVKYMVTPTEFIEFMKKDEVEKELAEDLLRFIIELIQKIPTTYSEELYQALEGNKYSNCMIKLASECYENESIQEFTLKKMKMMFTSHDGYINELNKLLTIIMSKPYDKYEVILKEKIAIIRGLNLQYPHYNELLKKYGSKSEKLGYMKPSTFSELNNQQKILYLQSLNVETMTLNECEVVQKYKRKLNDIESQKEVYDVIDHMIGKLKLKFPKRQFFDDCFNAFFEVVRNPIY